MEGTGANENVPPDDVGESIATDFQNVCTCGLGKSIATVFQNIPPGDPTTCSVEHNKNRTNAYSCNTTKSNV
jgi:hypothetical protein